MPRSGMPSRMILWSAASSPPNAWFSAGASSPAPFTPWQSWHSPSNSFLPSPGGVKVCAKATLASTENIAAPSAVRSKTFMALTPFGNGPTIGGRPLKIRFVCLRHVGVRIVVIFMPVFRANGFAERLVARTIGDGCGPGHGEGALVLNREYDLQELAAVIRVKVAWDTPILLCVPT